MLAFGEQEVRCLISIAWCSQCLIYMMSNLPTMAMTHGTGLILILLEYVERCCIGFGRSESTSTLINIIGAFFNYWKVLLLGFRIDVLSCNGDDTRTRIDFDFA